MTQNNGHIKRVAVEITGTTALLMDTMSHITSDDLSKVKRKTAGSEDPMVLAERTAYRMSDKTLYIPSVAVHGTMMNAAKRHKDGKRSAVPLIAGCVSISPEQISLGTKKSRWIKALL